MLKKQFATVAILAASASIAHAQPPKGYPDCPYTTKQACESDARANKAIREYARTHPEWARQSAAEVKEALDNSEGYTATYQNKDDFRQSVSRANQHFLDHYEPHTECQPSQIMSTRDMQNQWAGISSGPQGMDCATVYVPVYR